MPDDLLYRFVFDWSDAPDVAERRALLDDYIRKYPGRREELIYYACSLALEDAAEPGA